MKKLLLIPHVFVFYVLMGISSPAQETVPKLINYQGKLSDATGAALPSANYTVRFELFDKVDSAQAEDTLIWGEDRVVSVINGVFNVALGGAGSTPVAGSAVNNIAYAFGSSNRFLQTTILSGPGVSSAQVLVPRQQMVSTPFAFAAGNGVPTGTVLPFAGTPDKVPAGWLICDGTTRDGASEAFRGLYLTIGKAYNPATTGNIFTLPDCRGRTVVGVGQGTGLTQRNLASQFGSETHILTVAQMPAHTHGVTDPGHDHGYYRGQTAGGSGAVASSQTTPATKTTTEQTGISIKSAGGGSAHNIMQPSLALNYIIKL